jgi:hypothetical protein
LKQRSRWKGFRLLVGATGAALAGLLLYGVRAAEAPEPAPAGLGDLSRALSEPGGYFDTDNLISNETSYLQVADQLERGSRPGGAYLGVGPEQNFSYIARLRPSWAFIVDVRRDNAIQHLYFNALFAEAADPFQYLCRQLSRACPERTPESALAGIDATLGELERWRPEDATHRAGLARILDHVERLGFPLEPGDRETLASIHGAFHREQLDLRFRSHGRRPMPYHPTLRALLRARSPGGRGGFLDSTEDYRAVRKLQLAGRVVPVIGDFAGPHALGAVARFLRERDERVAAFYVSNVEFYLLRAGTFDAFVRNVASLPLRQDALFIRAYFDYGRSHPSRLPGHRSTTVLQPIPSLLRRHAAGELLTHWDVATGDLLRE